MSLIRTASFLLWTNGVGFGVPCVMAIRNLLVGKGIPYIMGFPAYGAGPFERHGLPTTIPLATGFLVVCVLECMAGWMLWSAQKPGAILALALVPFGAVYWWGFDLPIPPICAIARTLLIVLGWRALVGAP